MTKNVMLELPIEFPRDTQKAMDWSRVSYYNEMRGFEKKISMQENVVKLNTRITRINDTFYRKDVDAR